MEENKRIYSEVYSLLHSIGRTYIDKLPKKLYKMIEEERDEYYYPEFDMDMPLENQNISRKALAMIELLYLNYWCIDDKEKENLVNSLKQNEEIYKNEQIRKYDIENAFQKNKNYNINDVKKQNNNENIAMTEYKEGFFDKLKKFLSKKNKR